MDVIWSGSVASATSREKATGRPVEYRLTVYDNNQASCTCKAFLFAGLRSPGGEADRLSVRCKHLAALFKSGVFVAPGTSPSLGASTPTGSAIPPESPKLGAARLPDDDDLFGDEDDDLAPHLTR